MSVGYIDPNGDGAMGAWVPVPDWPAYSRIDDGTRQPDAPNTADYIKSTDAGPDPCTFYMTTLTVQSVSTITVWIYAKYDGLATLTSNFSTGSTYLGVWDVPVTGSWVWYSHTYSDVGWTQAQLDDARLHFTGAVSGPSTLYIAAAYAEITYTAGGGGNPDDGIIDGVLNGLIGGKLAEP